VSLAPGPRGAPASIASDRITILGAVTRPITLYALTLLVLEAAFTAAAVRARPEDEIWLLLIDAVVLTVLVCVFAVLIRIAPVALMGTEWLREPLAESLAEAVVDGLYGSIANIPDVEDQIQAWTDLVLWLGREQRQEGPVERQFRQFLVRGIVDRAMKRMPALRRRLDELLATERKA
jgi:hypothetical protein